MGRIKDKLIGKSEDIERYREASRRLERSGDETPEYYAANQDKEDAAKNVPWYRI